MSLAMSNPPWAFPSLRRRPYSPPHASSTGAFHSGETDPTLASGQSQSTIASLAPQTDRASSAPNRTPSWASPSSLRFETGLPPLPLPSWAGDTASTTATATGSGSWMSGMSPIARNTFVSMPSERDHPQLLHTQASMQPAGLPASALSLSANPNALGSRSTLSNYDVQITPLTAMTGIEGSMISFRVTLPSSVLDAGPGKFPGYGPQFSVVFGSLAVQPRVEFEPATHDNRAIAILALAVPPAISVQQESGFPDVALTLSIRSAAAKNLGWFDLGTFHFDTTAKFNSRRRDLDTSDGFWPMLEMSNQGQSQGQGTSFDLSRNLTIPSADTHVADGMTRRLGTAGQSGSHLAPLTLPDSNSSANQRMRRVGEPRTPPGAAVSRRVAPYDTEHYRAASGSSAPLPILVRAPQPNPEAGPSSPTTNAPRAYLDMHGDLAEMAIGWTVDEWQTGRRLVQFWRKQEGSTIHATFRPILPSQYVPNSIVVSCIFREDRNECFITSVDTIYLLEALVAARFTIEEKNRIRRNLEGFRPETVSKHKRGTEAFFKRIMGFPDPKPRNIEKDVKAFPWKVLGPALHKVVGKYVGQRAETADTSSSTTTSGHFRDDSGSSEQSISLSM